MPGSEIVPSQSGNVAVRDERVLSPTGVSRSEFRAMTKFFDSRSDRWQDWGRQHVLRPFFYVSDIHMEKRQKTETAVSDVTRSLARSVSWPVEMENVVLVAGDVADNLETEQTFYEDLEKKLKKKGNSVIVGVLGDDELNSAKAQGAATPDEYFQTIPFIGESELVILYRGILWYRITTDELLGTRYTDLTTVLSLSTVIILCGYGFGVHFQDVYRKVRRCAADRRVVVLTHKPFSEWGDGEPVDSWVYVSGHNHVNSFTKADNGAVFFADNQAVADKKPQFKSFELNTRFHNVVSDGIHELSVATYQADTQRTPRYDGRVFLLKRDGLSMYVLEGDSGKLYLLNGGSASLLEKEKGKEWYYNHLGEYGRGLRTLVNPYRAVQERLSEEIRSIGGIGTIHGAIIDIDYYNHVILNPFDGTTTLYYASSTQERTVYPSLKDLLEKSPQITLRQNMEKKYKEIAGKKSLLIDVAAGHMPVAGTESSSQETDVFRDSISTDDAFRDIYNVSRRIRGHQHAADEGVVRHWDDRILTVDEQALKRLRALQATTGTADHGQRMLPEHGSSQGKR